MKLIIANPTFALRKANQLPRREECDEIGAVSCKLPVEDKAYQSAALCVTAKLARQ